MESHSDDNNVIFLIITTFILVVGIVGSVMWIRGDLSVSADTAAASERGWFERGQKIRLTATPIPTETPVPTAIAVVEDESNAIDEILIDDVIAAVNNGGCIACHTIPGVPNAVGLIGPDLSLIGVDAATRIDGYTATEYIRESLMEPNAFTAPDCPTGPCQEGVMPEVQLLLGDEEIDILIAYLASLGVE